MLTDSKNRLGVIRELVLSIGNDPWRLQCFREANLFRLLSVLDSERPRVAEAIRDLCEGQFPSLKKSLGFQLRELKEMNSTGEVASALVRNVLTAIRRITVA